MKSSRKIPFLIGASVAFFTGVLCLVSEVDTNAAYFRIAAAMIIFYILGVIIRNTIDDIKKEPEDKRQENNLQEAKMQEDKLQEDKIQEDKTQSSEIIAEGVSNATDEIIAERKNGEKIKNIYLKAEAKDDEFTPLAASKFIKSKLNDK